MSRKDYTAAPAADPLFVVMSFVCQMHLTSDSDPGRHHIGKPLTFDELLLRLTDSSRVDNGAYRSRFALDPTLGSHAPSFGSVRAIAVESAAALVATSSTIKVATRLQPSRAYCIDKILTHVSFQQVAVIDGLKC